MNNGEQNTGTLLARMEKKGATHAHTKAAMPLIEWMDDHNVEVATVTISRVGEKLEVNIDMKAFKK